MQLCSWGEGGQRPKSRPQTAWCGDCLGHTEKEYSPSWSLFGRVYCLSNMRDLAGTTEQPFNSRGQRCVQRADNLVATFWLFFSRHSRKLHSHVTALLGHSSAGHSAITLSSGGRKQIPVFLSPLRFDFESQLCARDKTQKCGTGCAEGPGTDRLRARI